MKPGMLASLCFVGAACGMLAGAVLLRWWPGSAGGPSRAGRSGCQERVSSRGGAGERGSARGRAPDRRINRHVHPLIGEGMECGD